ncbi:LysR family transcriptional regulator [Cobetia sp. SIMBA_158]|uniref:LysR family transcriptional regulator n=1 Tax=Cobetia sp. SIMBA_158 TaxID=3081617 RepID=UPI00397EEB1A
MLGNLHDIDLKLLRVFHAICECGGFTQAQLRLGMSQASISTKMARLEGRLGYRLCYRGNAGFSLTPEGTQLLRSTQRLLAAVDAFVDEAGDVGQQLSGELNLGIIDNAVSNPDFRVADALEVFLAEAPGVSVNISVGDPANLEAQVLDGRLHLAIGLFNGSRQNLDYLPLYQTTHGLFCGREHPLFAIEDEELTEDDLHKALCLDAGYLDTIEGFQRDIGLGQVKSDTHQNAEGVALLVLSGRYVGNLPVSYAQRWVKEQRLRLLKPDVSLVTSTVTAIHRAQRPPAALVRFLEVLRLQHGSARSSSSQSP